MYSLNRYMTKTGTFSTFFESIVLMTEWLTESGRRTQWKHRAAAKNWHEIHIMLGSIIRFLLLCIWNPPKFSFLKKNNSSRLRQKTYPCFLKSISSFLFCLRSSPHSLQKCLGQVDWSKVAFLCSVYENSQSNQWENPICVAEKLHSL